MAKPTGSRDAAAQLTTLPNRLSVVLKAMPHAESVSVGFWVRAGGRYETGPLAGVSHFLEHLVFKGTRNLSCEELKQSIEGVGGSLNGFTAEEFTCYMAKVPADYYRRAISVLAEMVFRPSMRPADIQKEREVILEEIRMYEDTPAQHVHDVFNQLLWPSHPLGFLLSGTEETVRRISRADLLTHWRRFYHPRNALVSCAGALEPDKILRQLRKACGRPAASRPVRAFRRASRPQRGPQVRVVHKVTEQTHVCLGTPAMPRTSPHRFALELLHVLLGANMSSRLFREVREKRGLAYEIGTHIKRYRDAGAFIVYAGCDPAKLPTTVRIVVEQLGRIKRERVGDSELRRAKEFYRGQLLMALEDTMDYMMWMGEQAITVGRVGRAKDLLDHLERVTPREIQEVARLLFQSSRMYLAAVGPIPNHEVAALQRLCEF